MLSKSSCDKICHEEHQIVIKSRRSRLIGAMGSYMLHKLRAEEIDGKMYKNRWQDVKKRFEEGLY